MTHITIDCQCGKLVPVEGLDDTLQDEDYSPVFVNCECGERYEVMLHMNFLGKEPS